MLVRVAVLCTLAYVVTSCSIVQPQGSEDSLFISAFNIQVFGKSKMSKPEVVDVLVDIIQRYDLMIVQEIRDVDEVAFPQLVNDVNAKSIPNGIQYAGFMGPREGRTSSKEQYGFIYRMDKLTTVQEYLYGDEPKDDFEREPYVVKFQRLSGGSQKVFNIIPLHAKPDDAVSENSNLVAVYDDAIIQTGIQDSIILGDLNADCSYVCASCWNEVDLRNDDRFTWMIGDDADTTVSTTNCAYDRIVTAGETTVNAHGAKVFDFQTEYGLSYEAAKDVSDHYPVEFYLD